MLLIFHLLCVGMFFRVFFFFHASGFLSAFSHDDAIIVLLSVAKEHFQFNRDINAPMSRDVIFSKEEMAEDLDTLRERMREKQKEDKKTTRVIMCDDPRVKDIVQAMMNSAFLFLLTFCLLFGHMFLFSFQSLDNLSNACFLGVFFQSTTQF